METIVGEFASVKEVQGGAAMGGRIVCVVRGAKQEAICKWRMMGGARLGWEVKGGKEGGKVGPYEGGKPSLEKVGQCGAMQFFLFEAYSLCY